MDTKVPPVHRVALVTGAARGIGRATVDILYGQGYSVVAVDSCPDGGSHDLGVALSARLGLSTGCKNRNGAIIAYMRYYGNG